MVCEYAHSEDHALCPSGWGLIQTFPPSSRGGLVRTIDPNSSLLTLNLDLTLDALPYKERGLHYPCNHPRRGSQAIGRQELDIYHSRKGCQSFQNGATGPGGTLHDLPKLLNETQGTKFEVITGYTGTATVRIAMQKGEVDGACWSWESMSVTARALLDATGDERLIPFMLHGTLWVATWNSATCVALNTPQISRRNYAGQYINS